MALDLVHNPDALAAALAETSRLVEAQLDALLPVPETAEARLIEAMRYGVLNGGKRMRAFLVMQTAQLFSVNQTCAARVAAAVEMLHAYSLIHDDLPAMDDDDLRRGQPSCHKKFDEATAILAGDALQTRAFEVLAEADTHADAEARCELVTALGRRLRHARHGRRPDDRHAGRGQNPHRPGNHPPAGAENRPPDPVQRRSRRHPRPRPAGAAPLHRRLWPRARRRLPDL